MAERNPSPAVRLDCGEQGANEALGVAAPGPASEDARHDAPPSAAWRLGLLVLTGLSLGVVATGVLVDAWPWHARTLANVAISLQHVVTLAYLVGARGWLEARAAAALRALAAAGGGDAAGGTRAGERSAILLGLAAGALGPWLAEPWHSSPFDWWRIGDWSPLVAWHRVLSLLIGVAFALFSNSVVQASRRLSRLALADPSIDGFDRQRQRPFLEQGLTNGLLVSGLLCMISLFVIDHGANPMLVTVAGAGALLTVVAVLLPLRGVRARIRLAKAELLGRCDAEIRAFADATRRGLPGPTEGRIADMVALRSQVERLREWPFDTASLRRVVVYVLLPFATWLATLALQPHAEAWLRGS